MKTKILTLTLIALMIGITINSQAGKDDTLKVKNPIKKTEFQACINLYPDNIVQFQVVKPDKDRVRLRVYDDEGTLVYTYHLKKHNSAKIGFDTRFLAAGKYEYVVERNNKEVLKKTFYKENKGI